MSGKKHRIVLSVGAGVRVVSLLVLLVLAGCVTSKKPGAATVGGPAKQPDVPKADSTIQLPVIHGQYADPAIGSFPLYEVYLSNTGATARVFTKVDLDGRTLVRPVVTALETTSVSLDGFKYSLPTAAPDPDIVWWQFYPSAEVAPGASVVLRLCFRGNVRVARTLTLFDSAGIDERVVVPRRTASHVPLLRAVAYASDLSRIYVQCDSVGNPPAALWVCGRPAADLRILGPSDNFRFFLAEASMPIPVKAGMPIDLRVRFTNGSERRALLRVLTGVSVYDAPASEFSDEQPSLSAAGAQLISVDGVCSDIISKRPGNEAWRVIRERERLLESCPDTLSGFGFCTGVIPGTSAIYGRIADAIFSKPYRHGWGNDSRRFMDEEADVIADQRAACAPLPFLYIPERFERRGRSLSAAEVETLEWAALASGAKGLRRHFAFNAAAPAPDVTATLNATARAVRRLQPILAPLVPISDETQGTEKSGYVRILTAWSGYQGALFFIRDRSVGAFPEGAALRKNVPVELEIPSWCRGAQVVDLLTGKSLGAVRPGRCGLVIPELKAFRVLWVEADPVKSVLSKLPQE